MPIAYFSQLVSMEKMKWELQRSSLEQRCFLAKAVQFQSVFKKKKEKS